MVSGSLAAGLLMGLAAPALAQVVINEILFDPLVEGPPEANHQWVEIHNKGSEQVDLTGWVIAGRDGRDGQRARRLPAVSIRASGYLVLHFAVGQDQTEFGPLGAHYYSQESTGLWNPDQDEAALYSPSGIVDYLAWRRRASSFVPGTAHQDASAARIWQQSAVLTRDFVWYDLHQLVREIRPGVSAGRDRDSSDTNAPSDFDSNGGRHSFLPTPGRRNHGSLTEYVRDVGNTVAASNRQAEKRTVAEVKKWTVLWYSVGGDTKAGFNYLLDLQRSGGSTEDVNIVVHYTDYTEPARTARGRITSEARPDTLQLVNLFDPPIIEARNSAMAETLGDFVEWGKANYPAERYALVLHGDGQGWKFLGTESGVSGRFDVDRLYPGEIKQALDGEGLDVVFLGINYGSMVELAAQLRGGARLLVASPDRASIGLFRIQLMLSRDPNLDGRQLASRVLDSEYGSIVDLQRVEEFVLLLRQWVGELREAIPVFNKRDDPQDNVQTRIMAAARATWRARDENFMDLYHFARAVQADPAVPACAKRSIPAILAWLEANVTFYRGFLGDDESQLPHRGLTIQLPRFRSHRITRGNEYFTFSIDPHDHPSFAREVDGRSRRVSYFSSLNSRLPLDVEDEDGVAEPELNPRTEWPRKPAPDFLFPPESNWQGFLEDLFNPVADNHIVDGEFNGTRILPTSKFGGECRNPSDEITLPVGGVVNLSGAGSSDVDMANGLIEPYTHMWDLNHKQPCRQQPCRGPHEVDPGADALRAATDNLDADDEIVNTLIDDLDARGPTQLFRCTEPGEWITHLIAGDDDHLEPFHNTLPSAAHVASQTRGWPSTIRCVQPPGSFVSTGGAYPFTETGTWVFGDHAVVAAPGTLTTSPRNFIPRYPFVVTSGPGVTELRVNDVPLQDGTSNTVYADESGILRTRFTAGAAGTGSLFIQPLGLGRASLAFTTVNRLAPLPTELQLTVPAGNLTVEADASLTVAVTRNGEPLGDAIVTAWSPTSTATFVNGTLFRSNTATQLRAGSTGRFLMTFRPLANGPVHLNIVAGQIFRTLTLIAAGGPRREPTSLEVSQDVRLKRGQEGSLLFRVLALQQPLEGVTVRVEIQSGDAVIPGISGTATLDLVTNARGEAVLRMTPTSRTPARLRASVPGTSLAANAELLIVE
jgi:hypothetical protein